MNVVSDLCLVSRLRKPLFVIAGKIAEQVLHQSDVLLVFGVRFGTCETYSPGSVSSRLHLQIIR